MPLIVPKTQQKVDNDLIGKQYINEELLTVTDLEKLSKNMINTENLVFSSSFPNVVFLKEGIEHTALSGIAKIGKIPIIIDNNGIIKKVY